MNELDAIEMSTIEQFTTGVDLRLLVCRFVDRARFAFAILAALF